VGEVGYSGQDRPAGWSASAALRQGGRHQRHPRRNGRRQIGWAPRPARSATSSSSTPSRSNVPKRCPDTGRSGRGPPRRAGGGDRPGPARAGWVAAAQPERHARRSMVPDMLVEAEAALRDTLRDGPWRVARLRSTKELQPVMRSFDDRASVRMAV